jgi:preprotein translocase subunit YajC
MHLLFLAQTPAPAGPSAWMNLPFIFFMGVIVYFMMIRPQMKRQKDQQRLMSTLKTGDRVVTSAGIHGLISNVKETTVIVKVADNVKIEMEKSAVTNVLKSAEGAAS